MTDSGSAQAAQEAALAQAAVEAVCKASREVRLVTLDEVLAMMAGGEAERAPELPQEVAAALSANPGIASFTGLSGQTLYHAPDILSRTYALILDRKGSPMALMAEEIRANCRDYPRPVPVELFEAPPFGLTPEEIESALKTIAVRPECKDITFTTASTGAVYLFSTRHMDRGYATFLAERAETLVMNP
ncbi:MAG: hypothetical protein HY795_14900 [Desulfovibrio sp.]|nr:hypothetical protein [Desulfovibrio sp.]MBI4960361.1 hypothetical protein [Desulfovibrio sp.]